MLHDEDVGLDQVPQVSPAQIHVTDTALATWLAAHLVCTIGVRERSHRGGSLTEFNGQVPKVHCLLGTVNCSHQFGLAD